MPPRIGGGCDGPGESTLVVMTDGPRPLGPKANLVRAVERRRACNELVEHVTGLLDHLQSRPGLRARHFAAMSVARMARLVKAMAELIAGGSPTLSTGLDAPRLRRSLSGCTSCTAATPPTIASAARTSEGAP